MHTQAVAVLGDGLGLGPRCDGQRVGRRRRQVGVPGVLPGVEAAEGFQTDPLTGVAFRGLSWMREGEAG